MSTTKNRHGLITPAGVEVLGPIEDGYGEILSADALGFLAELERRFGGARRDLLARRREIDARLQAGALPDFLQETRKIREADWQVAPLPADLQDRRVEITGPVDRKMIINALNSGAKVFMADFEDATAPTWENLIDGQLNLRDAVRRDDRVHRARTGQALPARPRRLRRCMVRPRGWHLPEKHVLRRRRADLGSAVRLRPVLLPQRQGADRRAAPGPTSTCPSWRATSRRGCGTTCSCCAQERARRAARHDQGDRADRDDPRRVRDGRDPVRAARALGRAQLRPLGLHLQLHQEVPQPPRVRAARPRAGDDDHAFHALLLAAR